MGLMQMIAYGKVTEMDIEMILQSQFTKSSPVSVIQTFCNDPGISNYNHEFSSDEWIFESSVNNVVCG